MIRNTALAFASLVLLATPPSFGAERCRDAKGQFMKCPAPAPAAPKHCKDAKGKFAKCGTKGAMPM
ncbi:hypothetical protein [Aureimonas leprariae]|uniref:Uncharacterized protein n=1 Tax=Plantimonas leprariae TaxID=2615207 RepID=A0A7V7TXX6_9HYPH|nr:hypothetical protein [Aureimonas leprariae]KAB0682001.1 hypothetical protein F6X38_04130 [Aureimonas leprariae]